MIVICWTLKYNHFYLLTMWKDKKFTKSRERGEVFSFPFFLSPNVLKICSVFSCLSDRQKLWGSLKWWLWRNFIDYTTGDHNDSVFWKDQIPLVLLDYVNVWLCVCVLPLPTWIFVSICWPNKENIKFDGRRWVSLEKTALCHLNHLKGCHITSLNQRFWLFLLLFRDI